ncbi:DUF308 domain-containing protein [archaeon]|jgi:hypothetical protein|nr:DUF308 domain-containing protein [archaeon]MBT3578153.1 DUF308 domain-containing protein [archaeon]MBT6820701.1 DUF308 domain-containing protein [archaeon]MBT6956709.1 DUF308 domain-containing protein [archaeon]MBT7024890.1 DUF308 domain-containing protein [archaeon]
MKIRKLKNTKRGTEINYATLPIEEARVVNGTTLRADLERFYGPSANYSKLAEEIREVSQHPERTRKREGVPIEDSKRNPEEDGRDYLTIRVIGKKSPRIVLTPTPFVHEIWFGRKDGKSVGTSNRFGTLKGILKKGFDAYADDGNVISKRNKGHRFSWGKFLPNKEEGITNGDFYSIELYSDKGIDSGDKFLGEPAYSLHKSKPERILSVNIALNPDSTEADKEKKMEFYKKEIAENYNVPARFFESNWGTDKFGRKVSRIEKRIHPKEISLEQKLTPILAIGGLIAGIILISPNMTGNAIGNLTNSTSNIIGGALFVAGIVGSFLWFKKRN